MSRLAALRATAGPAGPVPAAPRRGLRAVAGEWFSRRNGPQDGDVRLRQRNIYVLPSRAGLLYGGVLAAMLVASINYQLSLGYALTFLLAAVGVVSILHTFRNVAQIVMRPGRAEPVFAGQLAEFSLMLLNPTRHERFAIRMIAPGMARETLDDLPPGSEQLVKIALPTERRGWMPIPRLTLWTTYPLGIWRAWAYWWPATRVLVYPTPESPAAPLPELSAANGEGDGGGLGEDDIAAIRPYVAGDPIRRIAWKAVARSASDELLTKQFDGGQRGELMLDWRLIPAQLDPESRLSRLTRWVVDAENTGARYGLRLPGIEIEIDGGPAHRERCLEALALARV